MCGWENKKEMDAKPVLGFEPDGQRLNSQLYAPKKKMKRERERGKARLVSPWTRERERERERDKRMQDPVVLDVVCRIRRL